MDADGWRGEDSEVEERRGDALEVFGVGEEGEDFVSGARDGDGAF